MPAKLQRRLLVFVILLALIAFLSVNIGIFNLLPVPGLTAPFIVACWMVRLGVQNRCIQG